MKADRDAHAAKRDLEVRLLELQCANEASTKERNVRLDGFLDAALVNGAPMLEVILENMVKREKRSAEYDEKYENARSDLIHVAVRTVDNVELHKGDDAVALEQMALLVAAVRDFADGNPLKLRRVPAAAAPATPAPEAA
ncbi:MAG TPA: hypothetical protein VGO62_09730 [Myxococcota bacterium]